MRKVESENTSNIITSSLTSSFHHFKQVVFELDEDIVGAIGTKNRRSKGKWNSLLDTLDNFTASYEMNELEHISKTPTLYFSCCFRFVLDS